MARRGAKVYRRWPRFASATLADSDRGRNNMVVVRKFVDGAFRDNTLAQICRVLGGYMTCDAWLRRAILERKRPKGFCFTGVVNTICCLYLSEKFRASNEVVSDVLLALSESTKSKVTVVGDAGRLLQALTTAIVRALASGPVRPA